jgi:hypothetical protein
MPVVPQAPYRSLVDPRAQRVPESSVRRNLSTSPDRPTIAAASKSAQINSRKTLQVIQHLHSGARANDESIHKCGKRANQRMSEKPRMTR